MCNIHGQASITEILNQGEKPYLIHSEHSKSDTSIKSPGIVPKASVMSLFVLSKEKQDKIFLQGKAQDSKYFEI